jgi:uncharacterized FAD-dependent dehydrogenase
MLRIAEIRLPVGHSEDDLLDAIRKVVPSAPGGPFPFRIVRQSVDARKKSNVLFVYTVDVDLPEDRRSHGAGAGINIPAPSLETYRYRIGTARSDLRPVIVGTGPAGLFAGLVLAIAGRAPILLERGKPVEERAADVGAFLGSRVLDPDSNVQFGEGGAGTFSDGKLTTQIKDPRCRKALEEFVAAGAPEEILYKNRPHIGTDLLRRVIVNMRGRIVSLGGEFRFSSRVTGLSVEDRRITGVTVNGTSRILSDRVILAVGNSARDTFAALLEAGVDLRQKPFSVGLRIEHPQKAVDRAQYGDFAGHPRLGPAEYKLVRHCGSGRSVYTFCMCPGGSVIAASSEEGCVVTNGMSEHARNGANANSAILVGVGPGDFGGPHPLAGIEFQRRWERLAFRAGGGDYSAPVQRLGDFMAARSPGDFGTSGDVRPSYLPGVRPADLRECLPEYVCCAIREAVPEFGRKLAGFDMADAVLTGVETRSSCPVRIVRNERMESNIGGLYAAGEGSGYAGGIVSSAVDGIRIAEAMTGGETDPLGS